MGGRQGEGEGEGKSEDGEAGWEREIEMEKVREGLRQVRRDGGRERERDRDRGKGEGARQQLRCRTPRIAAAADAAAAAAAVALLLRVRYTSAVPPSLVPVAVVLAAVGVDSFACAGSRERKGGNCTRQFTGGRAAIIDGRKSNATFHLSIPVVFLLAQKPGICSAPSLVSLSPTSSHAG